MNDKRFSDPTWRENPFYTSWLQAYRVWASAMRDSIDHAGLSGKNVERARFAVAQLTAALAPTNTLVGNPGALKKALETGGASLQRGLLHLLEDLMANGGVPSQVDSKAFKVGQNLATLEGAVVFQSETVELLQYAPRTEHVYRRPLLVVPPQINKFYILDLAPGRSLLEYLVSNGMQVFVLSWRNPSAAQRDWGLDAYVRAILAASDAALDITRGDDLNIVGACSGGITTAALLGYLAARGDRRVHAASLLVTVLDMRAASPVGALATRELLEAARLRSALNGVLAGEDMARVFAWLRPSDLVWNYWVNNYLLGNDPPAFDILYWNNDTTNLPARLHADFLDMFAADPFRQPASMRVLNTALDLSQVNCDAYIVGGQTDHITPWVACYSGTQLLGGACHFVLSSSGHIQSLVNPPGNPRAKFFEAHARTADASEWLAGAEEHSGSWWEHWREWLGQRSGALEAAPRSLGSRRHPVQTSAPGRYVVGA